MTTPITILTTVLNGERFLPTLIASVTAQTYGNFDWVIVDDGSNDRTMPILRKAARGDSRMRILENPRPGRGRALRLGVEQSNSALLAICDADDFCLPWRLLWQVEDMKRVPDAAVIGYGLGHYSYDNGKKALEEAVDEITTEEKHRRSTRSISYCNSLLKRGMPFGHSSCVFRRDAVLSAGNYDEERVGQYDFSLLTRIATQEMKVYSCPSVVGIHSISRWQHFENGNRRYRVASIRALIEAMRTIPGPSLPHVPYLARTAAPLLLPHRLTERLRRRL